ncbi:relaxase MobL, partial [Streptococcus anginosus]
REAMPKVIQKEGLSDSAFWWGNIHLNTDNIHVHIGLSEINSNREKIFYRPRGRMEYRGNFSQKTIKQLKSDVFHGLINEQTRN